MIAEIKHQLEKIAFEKTIPFCYGCYKEAPSNRCETCGSDDLMRLLKGSGCEYGTDWVIKELLQESLESIDVAVAFENYVRECYPEETAVGWMSLDSVSIMKEMDPTSWNCAQSEWEAQMSGEDMISFDNGSTYYWRSDLEGFIAAQAQK